MEEKSDGGEKPAKRLRTDDAIANGDIRTVGLYVYVFSEYIKKWVFIPSTLLNGVLIFLFGCGVVCGSLAD